MKKNYSLAVNCVCDTAFTEIKSLKECLTRILNWGRCHQDGTQNLTQGQENSKYRNVFLGVETKEVESEIH